MSSFINRHAWFPFVLAFVLLLSAWTTMIFIAVKNRPESVPLEHVEAKSHKEPTRAPGSAQ